MKLLLDENLSPRLPALLADLYPESNHVEFVGLRGATDTVVWQYAKAEGYVLVSKDNDFRQRSFQYLRESREEIERFVASAEEALLVVTLRVSD